jgi:hypothetical protein
LGSTTGVLLLGGWPLVVRTMLLLLLLLLLHYPIQARRCDV